MLTLYSSNEDNDSQSRLNQRSSLSVFNTRLKLSHKTNWPATNITLVDRLNGAMEKTLTVLSNAGWEAFTTQFQIKAQVEANHEEVSTHFHSFSSRIAKLIFRFELTQP